MSEDIGKQIISTVNELYDAGLITPKGGNVSARVAGSDEIWITPSQLPKGSLTQHRLIKLNLQGKKLEGRDRPSVETPMHLLIYNTRSDVNAIIHTHAAMATVLALFDDPIPPLTVETIGLRKTPRVPFLLSGTKELSRTVTDALADGSAVLLQNHGLLTVGKDLPAAASTAHALEFAARIVILGRLLGGEPSLIPDQLAGFLEKVLG
jgi:ribulose-5-phosphate 4-epimerase/fuculose-1-phosphate aldolase